MKTLHLLMIATVVAFSGAAITQQASLFVLGCLLLIFSGLEAFQTQHEKDLTIWRKEVEERRVDDMDDWHKAEYENMDEFNNN